MKISICHIVLGLLAGCMALSSSTAHASDEILVLVGRLISIKEIQHPCEPERIDESDRLRISGIAVPDGVAVYRTCIVMDALFEARYEVLNILAGTYTKDEITFKIADHSGFPDFANHETALLFVNMEESDLWLAKYQGYVVHRTLEDRWASCGNPYDRWRQKEQRHLQPIRFANPLGLVGRVNRTETFHQLYGRYTTIQGNQVFCTEGVYIEDLYEMVRSGVMLARGYLLPQLDWLDMPGRLGAECLSPGLPSGTRTFSNAEQREINLRAEAIADSLLSIDLHYDFSERIEAYPEEGRAGLIARIRQGGYPIQTNAAYRTGIKEAFNDIKTGNYRFRVGDTVWIVTTLSGNTFDYDEIIGRVLSGCYGIEMDFVLGHLRIQHTDSEGIPVSPTQYEVYAQREGYNLMQQLVLGWFFQQDNILKTAYEEAIRRLE